MSLLDSIERLGATGINSVKRLGASGVIMFQAITRVPKIKKGLSELMTQLYAEGVLSLVIIVVSGLFIGMVLALQGFNVLEKFGSTEELGQLVALSVTRELGPVVTGLLFAGRAGSALTAEIGLMQATEQISSLEMMAVDPMPRVIAPRFWAGVISMPLLTMIFTAVSVMGAYLVGVLWLGVDAGTFWSNMQGAVDFRMDVLNGIIKSFVFGIVITWIAVYQGYSAIPTAAGVGRSTTKTVVYSSLAVLGLDFVLTAMMLGGW